MIKILIFLPFNPDLTGGCYLNKNYLNLNSRPLI